MTENEIKKLLKKSLLKIPTRDFSEQVMARIHKEAIGKPQSSRDVKLSWFCITLAVFTLPFGLKFIFRLFSLYDSYLVAYLQKFSDNVVVQLGFILMMTIILLVQLDNLIGMSYFRKKWSFRLVH